MIFPFWRQIATFLVFTYSPICDARDAWMICESRTSVRLANAGIEKTKKTFYVFLNIEKSEAQTINLNGEIECPPVSTTKPIIEETNSKYSVAFMRDNFKGPMKYPSSDCSLNIERITGAFSYSIVMFVAKDITDLTTFEGACRHLETPPNFEPKL